MSKVKSKSGTKTTRRFPYGTVLPTDHLGDDRVLTPSELATLDPVPPERELPAEMRAMLEADPATLYVESDDEPKVRATRKRVGRGLRGSVWAVSVQSDGRPLWRGRTGLKQSVVKVRDTAAASRARYESSFRPPWARTEFLPRLVSRKRVAYCDDRPTMHTFDVTAPGAPIAWPWHCVGKVVGGFDTDFDTWITRGTGVLVGRNVLLTAAHCAVWNREAGRWWMRFFPGWYDGPSKQLGSSFVEQFRGPGPQSNPNSNDFVVCKLYDPLGDALGFLGYHWNSDDGFYENQRWLSVGYPSYELGGQRPMWELDIEVKDVDHNGNGREIEIALNNYLLNGGWSGGPLWGWFPGTDPRVIGVCSGWDSDGWDPSRSVFAGGGPLVSFCRGARQDWS